jgi:hypothetical protein
MSIEKQIVTYTMKGHTHKRAIPIKSKNLRKNLITQRVCFEIEIKEDVNE